ncbi:MAG: biotin--[acetyl-CoA-carboxylase] ligase [Thiotrichales bacterium]
MENSILVTLADGSAQPLADLARRHDVSVTELEAIIERLRHDGLTLAIDQSASVRWLNHATPLQTTRILPELNPAARAQLGRLAIFYSLDSTNLYLSRASTHLGDVCLAEMQTAGRGRRGRRWVSPPCANLYLSLVWKFDTNVSLDCLSLGIGAVSAAALSTLTGLEIGLKWPNDLYLNERKLGGILIDLSNQGNQTRAIIGIGINIAMPPEQPDIDQDWTQLAQFLTTSRYQRNEYVAELLNHLLPWLALFPSLNADSVRTLWATRDICRGRPVRVITADGEYFGAGAGVDESSRFRLLTGTHYRTFASGEVSLRLA